MSLINKIKIKDIMRSPVITVFVDDPLSKAAEIFVRERVYYLPVVLHDNTLVGMLTQKYLYKMRSPRRIIGEEFERKMDTIVDGHSFYYKEVLDSYILKNIMFGSPSKFHQDEYLKDVIITMAKIDIGCVTVIDEEDKVCGILTDRDVLKFVATQLK